MCTNMRGLGERGHQTGCFTFLLSTCLLLSLEEGARPSQDCLECSQAPVIMLLRRQHLSEREGGRERERRGREGGGGGCRPPYVYRSHKQLLVCSLGEVEDSHQLPPDALGLLEALREQDDLGNLLVVGARHGDRPKQLLQVVWQLLPPSVALPRWVHGDEDTSIVVQVNLK